MTKEHESQQSRVAFVQKQAFIPNQSPCIYYVNFNVYNF